jgi:hypothetical protein
MIQRIGFCQFCDASRDSGRNTQFTYEAKRALFDYLEDIGEEIELDVIALCCEWYEETLEDVLHDYGLESVEELEENTTVIEVPNGNILYQAF